MGSALKRMKLGKTLGPDGIAIEVWKCLDEVGMFWLTKLLNKIIIKKISEELEEEHFSTYIKKMRYLKLQQL